MSATVRKKRPKRNNWGSTSGAITSSDTGDVLCRKPPILDMLRRPGVHKPHPEKPEFWSARYLY